MSIRNKIISLLQRNGPMAVHDLAVTLGVSRQYIHRKLNELLDEGIIQFFGKSPHVFYSLKEEKTLNKSVIVDYEAEQFLKQHFIQVDALGNLLEGLEAFKYWCEKQNLNVGKTLPEFMVTRKKYLSFYNPQYLIDGTDKLKTTKGMNQIGVNRLYYLDFYAIERFGKTRLGTLMHYAKQGQNKQLMKKIAEEVRQRVYHLIQDQQIEAVLFVPPTIDRKIQIMTVLEKLLAIEKSVLKIKKIKGNLVIPQKALSNVYERIANAKSSFYIPEQKAFQRILI